MQSNRILIPASVIEFVDGGNTIWVHGPDGATVLRIKTMKKIHTRSCGDENPSHSDIVVGDPIHVCVGAGAERD